MKYLSLFFCIFLFSCANKNVLFENPQPAKGKSLTAFDKNMQGVYLEDSLDYLTISDKNAIMVTMESTHFHRSELKEDSLVNFDIYDDQKVLEYMNSLGIQARILSDTIYGRFADIDTLFSIGKDQILKKHNGNYFASIRDGEYWMVYLANLTNDTLIWREIHFSKDLLQYEFASEKVDYCEDSLGNLNNTDTCSSRIILNPTKKELNTLIREGKFEIEAQFIKKETPAKAK